MKQEPLQRRQAVRTYCLGFTLSLLFTLAAYFLATSSIFSKNLTLSFIVALCVIQALAQFIFFLHLGQESKPRWGMHTFFMTILILVIVVFGSIWIITSLNYRVMSGM